MIASRMVVVATSRETRDGMHSYLTRLGAEVHSTAELTRGEQLADDCDVLILFADDYVRDEAARTVRAVRSSSPRSGIIVVTRDEAAMRDAMGREERAIGIVFLCRPVWGWAMADAIRSQVARRRAKREA